ncbi:MAG: hypothetical protein D6775_04480 [Caldilineae bacterium]|nr:MAG: hypothetical protein D6775_04480 [Caldilineae bacterium]
MDIIFGNPIGAILFFVCCSALVALLALTLLLLLLRRRLSFTLWQDGDEANTIETAYTHISPDDAVNERRMLEGPNREP